MTTTKLLTTTLPTGEIVLAKPEKISAYPTDDYTYIPLRYGNETAAQKKLSSIQPLLSPARSASIVKQGARFLILIYDKPGYQSISHPSLKALRKVEADLQYMDPRDPFATVSGERQNPRNRHNHNHKDQKDQPYFFGG